MRRETTDEVEFTVACVNEFAQKHGILRQRPWRTVQYSFHTRKAVMCLCRKEVVYVS